jgi:hypothetical protein
MLVVGGGREKRLKTVSTVFSNFMKAIETEYKKHLFRSRLEARWAVYFDSLSIKWIYEPEGYELSNGCRYLPDFYLPEHKLFVEVKPEYCFDKRWIFFTREAEQYLLILDGIPEIRTWRMYGVGSKTEQDYRDVFLAAAGDKYFPFFDGGITTLYEEGDRYDEAVTAACSARFENF